jgi:hypothetical protein
VPPEDHNPDELDDLPGRGESPQKAGEFTRAFGGKPERIPETENIPPSPGSITQLLGGQLKKTSPPLEELHPPSSAVPNPPESRPVDSFTKAFDGVNAFTRNPANLVGYTFPAEAGRQPHPGAPPSESSGSFTRLFGSGEGILTPAGDEERPRSSSVRDSRPLTPTRPPEANAGSFTAAFLSPSAPVVPVSSGQPGSFTEEFGPPPSQAALEPRSPSRNAWTSPTVPGSPLPGYDVEPGVPFISQRTPATDGGFDRLVNPLSREVPPPSNPTLPNMRPVRLPDEPLPDLNYAPRGSGSPPGATVVFNPRPAEPELAEPRGESAYTIVRKLSDLRSQGAAGIGAPPTGAGVPAVPPSPPQYTPPVPSAWPPTPTVQPAPPWQPPQMAPPPMPQAPTFPAPALSVQPPTLGDKLVSFLPFMLALTVINFLGLLAVLIILFAIRK